MKTLRLHALAKQIAERMQLTPGDVRAVLASKATDLPKKAVTQITEMARTLIHDELMRLDAQRRPEGPQATSRRSAPAVPRRGR